MTCGTIENVVADKKSESTQSQRPSRQDSELQLVLEGLKDKDGEEVIISDMIMTVFLAVVLSSLF